MKNEITVNPHTGGLNIYDANGVLRVRLGVFEDPPSKTLFINPEAKEMYRKFRHVRMTPKAATEMVVLMGYEKNPEFDYPLK